MKTEDQRRYKSETSGLDHLEGRVDKAEPYILTGEWEVRLSL